MKKKLEIAFSGEVGVADCPCHKGKPTAVAFVVHPLEGRRVIDVKHFDTDAEAEEGLLPFVKECAAKILKLMGLEPDAARKTTITNGEDAVRSEQKYMAERNQNLH